MRSLWSLHWKKLQTNSWSILSFCKATAKDSTLHWQQFSLVKTHMHCDPWKYSIKNHTASVPEQSTEIVMLVLAGNSFKNAPDKICIYHETIRLEIIYQRSRRVSCIQCINVYKSGICFVVEWCRGISLRPFSCSADYLLRVSSVGWFIFGFGFSSKYASIKPTNIKLNQNWGCCKSNSDTAENKMFKHSQLRRKITNVCTTSIVAVCVTWRCSRRLPRIRCRALAISSVFNQIIIFLFSFATAAAVIMCFLTQYFIVKT